MRIAVFLVLYLSIFAPLKAQQQVFKINYQFVVPDKSSAEAAIPLVLTPLAHGPLLDSAANTASKITVYVDEQFSQFSIDTLEAYIHVVDKVNRRSSLVVPAIKQYITFDDSVTLSEQQPADGETKGYEIQLVPDSSKTIAGYQCKLALIAIDMGEYNANLMEVPQLEIWYAENIPTVHWGDYTFLQDIPGAALAIMADGRGIQATDIKKTAKEAGLFTIPEDYTLLIDEENLNDMPLADNLFTYQDEDSKLLGIWDENQQVITPAKYTYIAEFIGDLAVVVNAEGQHGIIRKNGQEFIACTYEALTIDSENDLIIFTMDGKTGVMDYEQKTQIPPTFAYLTTFSHGLAIFSEGEKSGLINLSGEVIVPATFESIVEYTDKELISIENERYYLVNINSKSKTNKGYDYLSFANEAGLFVASENGKYGYVDAAGDIRIPIKYVYATPFYDGIASVNETEDGETRYINTKGQYVQVDQPE